MDGVHDMGGMHGFGPVDTDADASFHADWERRIYAMNKVVRLQGVYTIDEYRHSIERLEPARYLGSSYFERWLGGFEQLLGEKGVLTEDEVVERVEAIRSGEFDPETATPSAVEPPVERPVDPADLRDRAREGFRTRVTMDRDQVDPAYAVGDLVRVENRHPEGHTRAPRYTRGLTGEVRDHLGTFTLADAAAHGGDAAEPVYVVRFDAADIWGPDTDADAVDVDMWESYLDPV